MSPLLDGLRARYPGLALDSVSKFEGVWSFRVCSCWPMRVSVRDADAPKISEILDELFAQDEYRCIHVGGERSAISVGDRQDAHVQAK